MNSIRCPLNSAAEHFENLPALISADKVMSYGEYEQLVTYTAMRLKETGVSKGERVAILSRNCWQYPILLFALLRRGAVACPVSPRFPHETIRSLLKKCDCTKVVDLLDGPIELTLDGTQNIRLDAVSRHQEPNTNTVNSYVVTDLDHDATIIFTSGTTAQPKAVLHSLGNHYYNALGSNKNIAVQPGDRWLLSLPLYHVGGLGILFRTMLGGGAVVIPKDKESIAESIEKYHVTHLSLVSTQLYRWLNQGLRSPIVMGPKTVLLGGSAVPSSLITRAHEAGLPLHTTYGLTEMASQVTTTAPHDRRDRLSTSGRVLDYRSLKLDDGEILVKGKTLFKGYVDGKTTTLPVDSEGWFRTGDIGMLDGHCYLEFLGRKDNMFISGGENIHPEEIEGVLCLLPDISEALVVPIDDEEFGFRPVAFIRTREGKHMDERDIGSHLERHLPRFMIPVSFHEWPDEVPKGRLKPDRLYLLKLAQERAGGRCQITEGSEP